jgi:hypothetical protein
VDGDDPLVANPAQASAGKKKRVKGTFWPWPVIPSDMQRGIWTCVHEDLRVRVAKSISSEQAAASNSTMKRCLVGDLRGVGLAEEQQGAARPVVHVCFSRNG